MRSRHSENIWGMEDKKASRRGGKRRGRRSDHPGSEWKGTFSFHHSSARVAIGLLSMASWSTPSGISLWGLPRPPSPHEFLGTKSLRNLLCAIPLLPPPPSLQGKYFMILFLKSCPLYTIYTISPSVQPLQSYYAWALGDKVQMVVANS